MEENQTLKKPWSSLIFILEFSVWLLNVMYFTEKQLENAANHS